MKGDGYILLKSELKAFIKKRIDLQTEFLINAEIEGLKARRDKARSFPYNQSLQLEAELLDAQIEALERVIE